MSTVTDKSAPLVRPSDAELVDALYQAALGTLAPEAATALAKRLASASAARSARQSLGGGAKAGSGRPKNWYMVQDAIRDRALPTQDVAAAAKYLGLSEASLKVYLAGGKRRHERSVETMNGTVEVYVRLAKPAEAAWLHEHGAGADAWTPPVAAKKRGSLTGD